MAGLQVYRGLEGQREEMKWPAEAGLAAGEDEGSSCREWPGLQGAKVGKLQGGSGR